MNDSFGKASRIWQGIAEIAGEAVARQPLSADLTSPDFWATGITALNGKVREYEAI